MGELIVGLVLFLGVHSVALVAPAWRDRMVERIGAGAWKGLYSLVALAGLALMVDGYAAARMGATWLYVPPAWLRPVGMLLLLPAFALLLAAYLPGRIRATLDHPMLAALKLWALAHLLMNGTVADVLLFGSLLGWAAADRVALARRGARPATAPTLPGTRWNDAVAIGGGLALYLAFVFGLHSWLIGIPVMV